MRMTTQHCSTLSLGHATPHAELDSIVKCVSKALVLNRAATTHALRHVLLCTLHE